MKGPAIPARVCLVPAVSSMREPDYLPRLPAGPSGGMKSAIVQAIASLSDILTVEESYPGFFPGDELKEEADAVANVIGDFAHKLNNATATILGKAQLAKMAVANGKVQDSEGKLLPALESIETSVAKICEALEALQKASGLTRDDS